MNRFLFIMLGCMMCLTGCQRKLSTSNEPKDLIVGEWSGTYVNPAVGNETTAQSMEFEFRFGANGEFRMGKRKVWVNGKYEWTGPKSFLLKIKSMPAGPYEIQELTNDRFVFQRKLTGDMVQRTELRRIN